MKTTLRIALVVALCAAAGNAQTPAFQDTLLDRFAGDWVLSGTIDGRETTHDVFAAWVLGHEYVQVREISREQDSTGAPTYEAIFYIGIDRPTNGYACLWLDNTGPDGLVAESIGHAQRESNRIAFLFIGGDGSRFHTTFIYDSDADTWRWNMDNEENGVLQPFARVTLTKQ